MLRAREREKKRKSILVSSNTPHLLLYVFLCSLDLAVIPVCVWGGSDLCGKQI